MTEAASVYGNRLRIRACGICIFDGKLLLAGHRGLVDDGLFWSPPGGGIQYGETIAAAVQREFREETGLEVDVHELLFASEFLSLPFHAIELFLRVRLKNVAAPVTGSDPEMQHRAPLLAEVRFLSMEAIKALPPHQVHRVLRHCESMEQLTALKGLTIY